MTGFQRYLGVGLGARSWTAAVAGSAEGTRRGICESPSYWRRAGPPVEGVVINGHETIVFGKSPADVASALGTKTIESRVNIDVSAFARMLAKIGYAYAVAALGPFPLDEVPVLPLIRGLTDDGSTWVGSADFRLAVEAQGPQHARGLIEGTVDVDGKLERILVARVKLFASSGATGYDVVVRRVRP